ncbi:MAG: hypothetical protein EGR15_06560, partial [Lachnospiraceae bacterium]|nr:hypothetical protein [Lachnospiraceae bacterium]
MNNRKWSRIIAMLLAVMLVFCDSNVIYAVESMTEAQTEDPAAAQAAADAEAARQAAEAQAAADAEAARQAAEAQAAADAEAARQAAEAQAAADAEAARQAAEAQAAADAEAAKQAAEAQAAADAEAAKQAAEAQTAAQEATDAETEPQTTPSATGSLTLKTEEASTQKDGEPARLKVTYELSADSSVDTVETRLYAWNKNAGYPQFTDGKFTDPETKREFQLKTDKDGHVYVEYILKKGESFTEEFQFVDTSLEVGTQITFDVSICANGAVPANCSIQSTTAKVTYNLPDENGAATEVETESNAPESNAVENTVAFQSAEGASVTVDGADVTNGTAMAKDGKIVFTVTPAEGYEVTSILVDGTIPARTNDETPETNDYIIEGIQTDSTVVVISTQAVAVESETESEPATEAATEVESESESETEAVTESESETVVETESESETETETVAETEVETESETEAVTETEAKKTRRKVRKAKTQESEDENGIAVQALDQYGYDLNKNISDIAEVTYVITVDEVAYDFETCPPITRDSKVTITMYYTYSDEAGSKKPTTTDPNGYWFELPNISGLDFSGENTLSGSISVENYDGSGGSYTVKQENPSRVTFDYDDKFLTAKPNGISGSFQLFYEINKSVVENTNEIRIDLGGEEHVIKLQDANLIGTKEYTVDEDGMLLFTIVLTATDGNAKNVTVTDKLTGNLQFIPGSFRQNGTIMNPQPVINGQEATITVGEVKYGQPVTITYRVDPNMNGESKVADSNSATWKWGTGSSDDEKKSGSADITVDYDKNRLDKSSEKLSDNQIRYTVQVNELAEDLVSNSDVLTLIDTITHDGGSGVYVTPILGSIEIKDAGEVDLLKNGKAVYSYDQINNKLTFTLPDATAITITYRIQVSGKADTTVNTITNRIAMEGKSIVSTKEEKSYKITKSNATVTGRSGSVKLQKKNKYTKKPVANAKYALYRLDIDNLGNLNGTKVDENITEADGIVTFTKGTENGGAYSVRTKVLYYLLETASPDGYLLNSTRYYFIMGAGDGEKAKINKSSLKGQVIYISDGGTIQAEDDTVPVETSLQLEASKKVGGTAATGSEFKFKLERTGYSKKENGYVPTGEIEAFTPVEVTNVDGKITFPEISFEYEGTYTFKITETDLKGAYIYDDSAYTVTVEVNRNSATGNLKITKKTIKKGSSRVSDIVFDNTKTTSFTLTKKVTAPVDADTTFTFQIEWRDKDGNALKKPENITITVKKGETVGTITFTGIPVGAKITVTEGGKSGWSEVNRPADGKYLLTINEDASKNTITVTNSYSASGPWTPSVTKKLVAGGRTLKDKEFSFVVKDQAGNTVMTGSNSSNNTEGNVTFVTTDEKKTNSISYTAPGTYIYTIEEVTPANKETNMSYSDAFYTVTVTVTDPKKDGNLKVDAVYVSSKESGNKTSAKFVNTYTAKGTWKPAVSKNLTGGASYGEGFTYTVKDNSTKKEVATGSSKKDGPISFTDITYDQKDIGKKYTYTIEETNKTRSDITYDDTVFTVSVKIVDKGNGVVGVDESSVTYKKEGTKVINPAFENKYKASGSAEIKGTKTLKNQILTAGAFTFGLFEDSDGTKPVKDASGKAITATNKAAREKDGKGEFVLNTPVYTQADIGKTYTYWVREISKGDQRYTYDTAAYQVSVSVSNKGNGELNVAVTYSSGAINFTNTYTATGSLDVTATKTVKGRTDVPNIFSFKLIEITGSTSKVLQTVENNGSQVIFKPINYQVDKDKDKTYTYILKEETGSAAGYVGGYSTEEYRITAKITDDGTGNLKVAKTIEKKNADGTYSAYTANNGVPSFTNTYKATGKLTLSGKKILKNHALEKDQFIFELYKVENYGKENQSYTRIDQKKNDADGSFTFDELTFNENQVGDNYYAVREVDEEAAHPGYSYLKDYVIVKVTVMDNGQGVLTATATPNGVTGDTALTITNTYTAEGRLQLKAHKSLTGAALRGDNKFSFTLTGPKKTNQTKINDLDGNVVFDTLEYDQSDIGKTYVYTLKETNEGKAGYIYDSKIYTVTVEVKDNHDGTLSTPYKIQMQEKADSTATDYTKSSDEKVKTPEFSNSYEATGSAVLSGTKKLIGGTKELKAGDFSFKIYEVKMQKKSDDSDELVEVEEALKDTAGQEITVSNDAKGNFTFPEISYTQNDVGVHTYRIKEINDGKPGYTYDPAAVEVTINVKDNHDKTLDTTERTYKKGSNTGNAISFENFYEANGSFTPLAIKKLEGHKLSADQFTFVLYEVKDKEEKELERKTNDAAGVVSFTSREYSQADIGKTFVYRIKEVNDGADGYTYSEEEYTITVSVTDNNGSLTVTPVYTNKEGTEIKKAEEVVFKNAYAATGSATISGTKTLTGNRTLDNEQFSFKLTTDPEGKNLVKDSEGNDMIVKNDADGNFTFSALQYDQDDVKDAENIKAGKDFTYYVSEIANPNDKVYTYSTRIYKVVINVKDDGGKLAVAKPVITDLSTGEPADIAFENHYNAKGSLKLTATKKLDVVSDKVKLSANLFSFTLIGDNIKKQIKWNNEDGSVIFDSINYTEADIDKDFTYTMTEQYGKLSGFEYSNEVYTIKVHISDNRDGSLNVDAKVTNSEGEDVKLGEIQFVNKYEATGSLTL